jgi:AcrR family transcriptional regulator
MKTLRADALRNREQIVSAARILFITNGPDAPMEDVARAAGVGVGTLYRRFPDRNSLLTAVATDVIERLAAILQAARSSEPDAWQALRRYLYGWAEFRLGLLHDTLCHGMPAAVQADVELRRVRETWLKLLEELLGDARDEGSLRPEVTLTDVATFMNMLIRLDPGETTTRLLEFMLDGLRV